MFDSVFTCTAECYSLVQGTVIAQLRGFAYNYSWAVVDKQSLTDGSTGVDLYTCDESCGLAYDPRREKVVFLIQRVRNAVSENCVESRVGQHDLERAFRRGVTFLDDLNVLFDLVETQLYGGGEFYFFFDFGFNGFVHIQKSSFPKNRYLACFVIKKQAFILF